jgi:glycopeptide antibiotics resistance protein
MQEKPMISPKTRMPWLIFLLTAYLILLFKLIIMKDLPSDGRMDSSSVSQKWDGLRKANFTPFKTISYYGTLQEDLPTGIQNVGGNIILFIPVGFLFTAFLKDTRLIKVLLYTLLISAVFEILQLFTSYGTCDVDDLLLNTIGGLIGYALYFMAVKLAALFRNKH